MEPVEESVKLPLNVLAPVALVKASVSFTVLRPVTVKMALARLTFPPEAVEKFPPTVIEKEAVPSSTPPAFTSISPLTARSLLFVPVIFPFKVKVAQLPLTFAVTVVPAAITTLSAAPGTPPDQVEAAFQLPEAVLVITEEKALRQKTEKTKSKNFLMKAISSKIIFLFR